VAAEIAKQVADGPGVDGPVRVQHGGGQRAERTVAAAAGVVADEDVQVPEGLAGRVDETFRGAWFGEVRLDVPHAGHLVGPSGGDADDHRLGTAGVGTPGLIAIVRGELVQEQARAQRGQPAGDGVSDARPPADPGDHRDPAAQRDRISPQLIRGELG
jgi:hypothetical protein